MALMPDMETTTSTESPLLDKIPAEIRLLVYEEVLRFERPLVKVKPSTRPIRANTNLLLVNKQITQEALPALYKVSRRRTGAKTSNSPQTLTATCLNRATRLR